MGRVPRCCWFSAQEGARAPRYLPPPRVLKRLWFGQLYKHRNVSTGGSSGGRAPTRGSVWVLCQVVPPRDGVCRQPGSWAPAQRRASHTEFGRAACRPPLGSSAQRMCRGRDQSQGPISCFLKGVAGTRACLCAQACLRARVGAGPPPSLCACER